MDAYNNLLRKMRNQLGTILNELLIHESKVNHWIWIVFPTTKVGFSEPYPKTFIQKEYMGKLLSDAPELWKIVLEKICLLCNKKGIHNVFPWNDLGRISNFITLWGDGIKNKPIWLRKVIKCLKHQFRPYS